MCWTWTNIGLRVVRFLQYIYYGCAEIVHVYEGNFNNKLPQLRFLLKFVTDPVGNIVSNMEVKRSKGKVMEKILELELVEDRKELYKKRSGGKQKRAAEDSDSEDDTREYQEGRFLCS